MTSDRARLTTLAALFAGIGLLTLGNGLGGTLIGVRATIEGYGQSLTGLVMSAYFVGYLAASLLTPRIIHGVGHIRTFAAMASLASIAALGYAILVDPFAWIVLRAAHGACHAGLMMVAESWLNVTADKENRGRILASHAIVIFAAWSLSQWLLPLGDPDGFLLFCLVSILVSASLLPITLSQVYAPRDVKATRVTLRRLITISPLAALGCLTVGLVTGAFFGLGPVFVQSLGLGTEGTAQVMSAVIAGALCLEWPLGWLSDRFDRRRTLTLVAVGGAAISFALAAYGTIPLALKLLGFLFGGLTVPLYSLSIAHANDYIERDEAVGAASSLLLVFGIGSMLGPLTAGFLMERYGGTALFLFAGMALSNMVAFALVRMVLRRGVSNEEQGTFVATTGTTHMASDLDPRGVARSDR